MKMPLICDLKSVGKKLISFLLIISFVCEIGLPLFSTTVEASTTITRKYGDVNWDGKIDSVDSLLVQQHNATSIAKIKDKHPDWVLTGDDFKVADVTRDGKVDSIDFLRIQEYISASTIDSIRIKHPNWCTYLSRNGDYRYNLKITCSVTKVNLDLNGNNACKVTVSDNYGRTRRFNFVKVSGTPCANRVDGSWNKTFSAYSFTLKGETVGDFSFCVRLIDSKKNTVIASSDVVTVSVKKGSSAIPVDKKITVFRQNTDYYKKKSYGTDETGKKMTMYTSACGVFAVVNAVYYLKNTKIDPETLAKFALNTKDIKKREGRYLNLRYPGGTSDNLAKVFCDKKGSNYGIKFIKSVGTLSAAKTYLQKGNVAVAHVKGHFVALVNYNPKTGKYLVLDSYPVSTRGTSNKTPYRWMTAKQFTGKMALFNTDFNNGYTIQIIGRR